MTRSTGRHQAGLTVRIAAVLCLVAFGVGTLGGSYWRAVMAENHQIEFPNQLGTETNAPLTTLQDLCAPGFAADKTDPTAFEDYTCVSETLACRFPEFHLVTTDTEPSWMTTEEYPALGPAGFTYHCSSYHEMQPVANLGEEAFDEGCTGCHDVGENEGHGKGPNLFGVFGSPAARHTDFLDYSDAMADSGIVWTWVNLDEFLKNVGVFLPGNSMTYGGPSRIEQPRRGNIIAYLATLH